MATTTQTAAACRSKSNAIRTAKEKLGVLQGMSNEIGAKMSLLRDRVDRKIEPETNERALRGLESQMEVIEIAVDAVESTMEACLV